jgi:hypothetical protein
MCAEFTGIGTRMAPDEKNITQTTRATTQDNKKEKRAAVDG